MTPFSIAGVQMAVSATHENVTAMTSRIDHVMALFPWVEMILFSELPTVPGGDRTLLPGEGASILQMKTTAGS